MTEQNVENGVELQPMLHGDEKKLGGPIAPPPKEKKINVDVDLSGPGLYRPLPGTEEQEAERAAQYMKATTQVKAWKSEPRIKEISAKIDEISKELDKLKKLKTRIDSRYTPTTEEAVLRELSAIDLAHPDRVTPFRADIASLNGSAGGAVRDFLTGTMVGPAVVGPHRNQVNLIVRGYIPGNGDEKKANQTISTIRTGQQQDESKQAPRPMEVLEPRNLALARKNITEKLDGFLAGTELGEIRNQFPEEFAALVEGLHTNLCRTSSPDAINNAINSVLGSGKSPGYKTLEWLYSNNKELFTPLGELIGNEYTAIRLGHGKKLLELLSDELRLFYETLVELQRSYVEIPKLKWASVEESDRAFEDSHICDQYFHALTIRASAILSILVAYAEISGRALTAIDIAPFYVFAGFLKGRSDLSDKDNSQYQVINWTVKNVLGDSKIGAMAAGVAAIAGGVAGILGYLGASWSAKQIFQMDLNDVKNHMKLVGKMLELSAAMLSASGGRAKKAGLEAFSALVGLGVSAIPNNLFSIRSLSDLGQRFQKLTPDAWSRLYGLIASNHGSSTTLDYATNYLPRGVSAFIAQLTDGQFQALLQKKFEPKINAELAEEWRKVQKHLTSSANVKRVVEKRNAEIKERTAEFEKGLGTTVDEAKKNLNAKIKSLTEELSSLKVKKSEMELAITKAGVDSKEKTGDLKETKEKPKVLSEDKHEVPVYKEAKDEKEKEVKTKKIQTTQDLVESILTNIPGTKREIVEGLVALDKRMATTAQDVPPGGKVFVLALPEMRRLEAAGFDPVGLTALGLGRYTSTLCYKQLVANDGVAEAAAEAKARNDKAIASIREQITGIKDEFYKLEQALNQAEKESPAEGKETVVVDKKLTAAELTEVEKAQLESMGWTPKDISRLDQGAIAKIKPLLEDLAKRDPASYSASAQSSSVASSSSSGSSMTSGSMSSTPVLPVPARNEVVLDEKQIRRNLELYKSKKLQLKLEGEAQGFLEHNHLLSYKEQIGPLEKEIKELKGLLHIPAEVEEMSLTIEDFSSVKDEALCNELYVVYLEEHYLRLFDNHLKNHPYGSGDYVGHGEIDDRYTKVISSATVEEQDKPLQKAPPPSMSFLNSSSAGGKAAQVEVGPPTPQPEPDSDEDAEESESRNLLVSAASIV